MPTSPFAASHSAHREDNAANFSTPSLFHENGSAIRGERARTARGQRASSRRPRREFGRRCIRRKSSDRAKRAGLHGHLHDFWRAHEADRQDRLAKAAGNDQMATIFFDMPVYVRRAETQFGEDWTGERQIDLAAVSVAGKRQRDALWRARKDERLMRQQDRRSVVGNFGERPRQIVKAAPMAGAGADGHLVGKAREPERRAILR